MIELIIDSDDEVRSNPVRPTGYSKVSDSDQGTLKSVIWIILPHIYNFVLM
jgi:hypothetical protein